MTRGIQKKRIKMAIHPSIYLSVRLSLLDIRILFYSILSWQWHHIQNEKHKNRIVQMYVCFCSLIFRQYLIGRYFFQFNSIQCNGWLHRNDDDKGMNWKQSQKRKFNWFHVQRERERERERKWSIFFQKIKIMIMIFGERNLFVSFRFNKRHLGIKGFFWL